MHKAFYFSISIFAWVADSKYKQKGRRDIDYYFIFYYTQFHDISLLSTKLHNFCWTNCECNLCGQNRFHYFMSDIEIDENYVATLMCRIRLDYMDPN